MLPTLSEQSPAWLSTASMTYLLIVLAEFGDKSQLVCMTLAARHRGLPVLLGAGLAFALLNLLAVAFGSAIAAWLPGWLVTATVAALFAGFGIQALRHTETGDDEAVDEKSGHSIFITTFFMIFLAEFGDKTQIAVAGISSNGGFFPVWFAATAALISTSALGIFAGQRLIKHLSIPLIQRISGVFFLLLACAAAIKLIID